ncbi:MAG: hypothetical protein GY799_25700 [Desulfobulbaceae bacterium]|nr:hypothetical protein [Desulfobulbaceae bacterium]
MPASKNRIIEIAYKLKDQFTGALGKITGGFKKVEDASNRQTRTIERNSSRASSAFSGLSKSILKFSGIFATAFSVSRGATAFGQFTERVDKLGKTAGKLGTTTDALSRLGYAASITGVNTEKMNLGLQMLARNSSEAAQGTGEAKDAFEQLGLNALELSKLKIEDQFKRVADAFENVGSQSDKVSLAMDLFGRSGADLINTMKGGSKALNDFAAASDKLGNTISQDVANEVQDFNDNMTRLEARVDSLGRKLGGPIVAGLNDLFSLFGPTEAGRVAEINYQIEGLQRRLETLGQRDAFWDFGKESRDIERSNIASTIRSLVDEIVEIQKEETTEQENGVSQRRALDAISAADKTAAAEVEKSILERKTKDLVSALNQQEAVYQSHLSKVKSLLQQETDIKTEFESLAEELSSAQSEEITEPDYGDINDQIGKAFINISSGNFDQAIENARKGGEYLRLMKEEGIFLKSTLSGVAIKLGEVARQAQEGKTEASILDAEKEKAEAEKIKDVIKKAKAGVSSEKIAIPVDVDDEGIAARIASAVSQAQASVKPIVIPIITTQGGTTFTDGTDSFEESIEDELLQTGSK